MCIKKGFYSFLFVFCLSIPSTTMDDCFEKAQYFYYFVPVKFAFNFTDLVGDCRELEFD